MRSAVFGAALASLAAVGAMAGTAPSLAAQVDSSAALQVGQSAPDFTAPGATRYGLLRDPVSLSDFSGKTVVLAFFYKARTKG
ncbi:MAG TPA: redoxin domain-containing protein [Gemmatimonadaceae bacterium]|nr:redoxin domain-containing protein [Gemmatimonadaceae bacterium]